MLQSIYKKETKEQLVHCEQCRGVLCIIEDVIIEHICMRMRCPHCGQNWRVCMKKDEGLNINVEAL